MFPMSGVISFVNSMWFYFVINDIPHKNLGIKECDLCIEMTDISLF